MAEWIDTVSQMISDKSHLETEATSKRCFAEKGALKIFTKTLKSTWKEFISY